MSDKIDFLQANFDKETQISAKVDLALRLSKKYRFLLREKDALKVTDIALEAASKNDFQIGIAKLYKEISLIYYSKLTLDKALDYCFKALSIFKTLGDNQNISKVLCNIGVFYNALNLTEKAKEYFLQSYKYYPENTATLNNLGEHFAKHGKSQKAIEYFEKTKKISQVNKNRADLAYVLKSLGELYLELAQNEEAVIYFKQALKLIKSFPNANIEAFVLLGLSKAYLKKEKSREALHCALKSLKIAEKLKNNEVNWFCYSNLANVYEAIGDFEKANNYLKLSLNLHEQVYSEKITYRIAELEAAYEIEKKELETKQLLEKNARLATIGVLAAGITHEINQPLNSIVINSDGILFKDEIDKVLPIGYRDSIEKICKSAQRIDQIIKHMRTYWNSGENLIRNKMIDVNNSISGALGLLQQQIRSHGIELNTSFTARNPFILGNQVHLEQIIINLVTNSIHALDSIQRKLKKISIKTRLKKDIVQIFLEDNGNGIIDNSEKDIFDPFYSTKKPDEGMGLGLAIVKNYITQMNGEIIFKNKESGGVIFRIVFPLSRGEK